MLFFFLKQAYEMDHRSFGRTLPTKQKKIIVIKDLIWITQSCIIDCGLDNNAVSLLNILILVSYCD